MAQVFEFPTGPEREWRGIEEDLRAAYAEMPDGPACIEEAMPSVKKHFSTLYPAFSVTSNLSTPSSVPEEFRIAVAKAIEDAVAQVVLRLRSERANTLAALAAAEYKAAYYRRNPSAA